MKHTPFRLLAAFASCVLVAIPGLSGILIDFGMNGSTPSGGHPDQQATGTAPVWNNIAVGNATGGALATSSPVLIARNGGLPTLASASLLDTTGANSGWTLSFASSGTTAAAPIGTAGTAGNYTGTVPPAAAVLFPEFSATRDSLYINTSGVRLTVTIAGLNDTKKYDLTAFGARNGTSVGGTWTLVTGSATLSRFQNSAGVVFGNTGQTAAQGGTNAGLAVQWLNISPVGGMIAFRIEAKSSGPVDLNALSLAIAAPLEEPVEVDVYLLGGQSNMLGLGVLSELDATQRTPPAEVFYWNGSSFEALIPGTTQTAGSGQFGPEIGFATEIARRGRKAYIIKYANSGKPLDAGWNDQSWIGDPPGTNRVNFYPGLSAADAHQGTLYRDAMLPRFQAGIEAIRAVGETPVVKGLVWMQGEQDSKNAVSAGRYAENLARLRDRLESDLALTLSGPLPVVFGQVLPHEPPEERFAFRSEIRAEMALADQDSGSPKAIVKGRMVSTDGLPVLPSPDAVHYTTAGQLELGKRLAKALAELSAQPLHVAFHRTAATRDAMAPAAPPLAQGAVVRTDTTHWNNLLGETAHTFSAVPLVNADGTEPGAWASGTTGYTGANGNGWASASKDAVMMEGWYGFNAAESLTIGGIPPDLSQRYHVRIYGESDDPTRVMQYTIGSETQTNRAGMAFNGTFTEGLNYMVFRGLSGSSFTLTGNPAGSSRSAVNGISIFPGDPVEILSFTASDYYVGPGESVTLAWSVEGATSVEITPDIGPVQGSALTVSVAQTKTYTLSARRGKVTDTRQVRVVVGPPRPNIVLFMVDDMGWQDTSVPFQYDAAGQPVVTGFNQRYRTPNMEALAASGMKFTRAYSSAVCTPTRISLMTGQSAARHNVTQWTLYQDQDQSGVSATLKSPVSWNVNGLAPDGDTTSQRVWRTDNTLPRLLHGAGYRTIHTGKAHFGASGLAGEDPLALGFDVNIAGHAAGGPGSYLGTDNYGTGIWHVPGLDAYHGTDTFLSEALTREATKAMGQAVSDGVPFYLYMAHYAIHVPLVVDPRFQANYPGVDATETKYATMIEGMDKSLGDIRAKLQELGVAENTLILFYSDNGGLSAHSRGLTPSGTGVNTHNKPLRAGKGSAYEGGIRVPALAGWGTANSTNPFQQALPIAAGTRCDKPLIIEDLCPTLLEIAGIAPGASMDGCTITPYLRGDAAHTRPGPMLFHYPHIWSASYIGMNQGYEMHSSLVDGDWKIIHFYEGRRWELYNLADDPGEAANLAGSRRDLLFPLARKLVHLLNERGALFPAVRTSNIPQPPLLPNDASVDSDGDGLPDIQEDPNRNGAQDPGETDPDKGDSDLDGTLDGTEFRVGTDPLDPASAFKLRVEPPAAGGPAYRLVWPSLPGTSFTIRTGPTPGNLPDILIQNFPAAAAPERQTHYEMGEPTLPDRKLFRVGVE